MTTNQGLGVLDLKPCLMVAAKISRQGGQQYRREDEQQLKPLKPGEQRTQWVTKKVIDDEAELKRASKLQTKCKYGLGKLGRHIPLGVLVAADKMQLVQEFRREWRQKFQEFNENSCYTKIRLSFWIFAVRGENVQELEQVLDDLRVGIDELEQAYRSVDPGNMRDVITRMAGFTELLPERAAQSLQGAVRAAKKRAKGIAKAERHVQAMQRCIEQELGPEQDVQAELNRLAAEPLTAEIRTRTRRMARLNSQAQEAVQELEIIKTQIDTTPIRLARFAVQRKRVEADPQDDQLTANRLAGRVARVQRAQQTGEPA